jgi:predicted RNase H-like HicB family nuclease
MTFYVALIDGEGGAFGVVVLDLPGCTSAGGTVEEALRNAAEAAPLWRDDARADGEVIPEPRAHIKEERRILLLLEAVNPAASQVSPPGLVLLPQGSTERRSDFVSGVAPHRLGSASPGPAGYVGRPPPG